jgi:hypothetical protein
VSIPVVVSVFADVEVGVDPGVVSVFAGVEVGVDPVVVSVFAGVEVGVDPGGCQCLRRFLRRCRSPCRSRWLSVSSPVSKSVSIPVVISVFADVEVGVDPVVVSVFAGVEVAVVNGGRHGSVLPSPSPAG